MWAFKFKNESSRSQVPSYGNFMASNHSLLKLWYEDVREPLADRIPFSLRCMRFCATISMLFIAVYLIIWPADLYYN